MNKKGFTLTELLGVIAILGVLVAMSAAVYTKVFDNQKEHAYQNKVSTIEVAAEKWAEETNLSKPMTITVKRLVAESFYQADSYNVDKELAEVNDPRDDSSMLCNTIDITFNDGVALANFTEEKDCDLSRQEEEKAKIKIAAYEYDTASKKVIKVLKDRDDLNTLLPWTRNAVLLVVEPTEEGYKDYNKVIYTNGAYSETKEVKNNIINTSAIFNKVINPDKFANTYLVDAELILNTEYNIAIELPKTNKDDKIYGIKSNDVTVRIDKENPSLSIKVPNEYTTGSTKKIEIKGSDGSGSGVKAFYVTTSPNGYNQGELKNDPNKELINNTLEVELKEGTYYVYAMDNVGNISNNNRGEKIEVTNIDDSKPQCRITVVGGTLGENGWYTDDITLRFEAWGAGVTGFNYYFGTSSGNGNVAKGYVKENGGAIHHDHLVTANGTQQYYGYLRTPLGTTGTCDTTGVNDVGLRKDDTRPTCSISASGTLGDNDWYTSDVTLSYSYTQAGPSGYGYNYGLYKSDPDYNQGKVTNGNTGSASETVSDNGTTNHYGYLKTGAGLKSSCDTTGLNNGEGLKIDKTKPTCSIDVKSGTLGSNYWYTSDVNLAYSYSQAGPSGYDYYYGPQLTPPQYSSGSVEAYQSKYLEYLVTANGTAQYYGYLKTRAGLTNQCDTSWFHNNTGLQIDKDDPTISAKKDPIGLGTDPYTFTNNISYTCGVSGLADLSCSPSTSDYTKGSETVSCTVTCNNGKTASTSFTANYSYKAGQMDVESYEGEPHREVCLFDGGCSMEPLQGTGACADETQAKKCNMKPADGYRCSLKRQWIDYCCTVDGTNCTGGDMGGKGHNQCSGDYGRVGKDWCPDDACCADNIRSTEYRCPNWKGSVFGSSYSGIKCNSNGKTEGQGIGKCSTSKGGTCYYCPVEGSHLSGTKCVFS